MTNDDKPIIEIDAWMSARMERAENIASNYDPSPARNSDTDELLYALLNASVAQNRMLKALIDSLNDSFKGLDLLMGDIMKQMQGDSGGF